MTVIDTKDEDQSIAASPILSTSWLAGLGATVGFGALISSSCCALPIALAALGAGGAVFSGLEFLVEWRSVLLSAAGNILLSAWGLFFQRRATACSVVSLCSTATQTNRTAVILGVGTIFITLAIAWNSLIEPTILKILR